jgi:uncharacterized membrane protein YdjX (TVP38/TMEM64 family)
MLVNLAIGASDIRFIDFAVGTLIGMAPGLIAISYLGHHIDAGGPSAAMSDCFS